jgi:hypothetical protein
MARKLPVRVVPLVVAALLLPALPAAAKSFRPNLGAFIRTCPAGSAGCSTVDLDGFDDFASQLAATFVSRFAGPIDTTGPTGLEISYTVGLTELDRGREAWKGDAATGRPAVFSDPGSLLVAGQVKVRKGLPAGLQLGGVVTQVYGGGLWGVGLELGWAFLEGIDNAPDMGLQLQAGTVLGNEDLLVVNAAASLILSKSIGVAGLFSLAPYGGYQFLYTSASTHLTGAYPQDATQPNLYAIDPRNLFGHRLVFGLEALVSWVQMGFEMTVQLPNARRTYAFKLGAEF